MQIAAGLFKLENERRRPGNREARPPGVEEVELRSVWLTWQREPSGMPTQVRITVTLGESPSPDAQLAARVPLEEVDGFLTELRERLAEHGVPIEGLKQGPDG